MTTVTCKYFEILFLLWRNQGLGISKCNCKHEVTKGSFDRNQVWLWNIKLGRKYKLKEYRTESLASWLVISVEIKIKLTAILGYNYKLNLRYILFKLTWIRVPWGRVLDNLMHQFEVLFTGMVPFDWSHNYTNTYDNCPTSCLT